MEGQNEQIFLYIHINLINDKVYIGQTNNPKRRWRNKGVEYKPKNENQSRFWNAICKYGWDNFQHIIIGVCKNREEANQKEAELIKKYCSYDERYGYNIATDCNYIKSYFFTLSEEEQEQLRKEQSKRSKEYWTNEEYRKKQKEGMKKVFASDEYRQKMSKSLKKRYEREGEKEAQKKRIRKTLGVPIYCIELNLYFGSISEANEFFKKSTRSTAINDYFRGKSKSAFGYHWKKVSKEEFLCHQQKDLINQDE